MNVLASSRSQVTNFPVSDSAGMFIARIELPLQVAAELSAKGSAVFNAPDPIGEIKLSRNSRNQVISDQVQKVLAFAEMRAAGYFKESGSLWELERRAKK